MSAKDTEFEFLSSLEKDENHYLTKDRQFIYYNDLQGGNYSANSTEVKFELAGLANSAQFINWAESFLLIPLQLQVTSAAGILSGTPENIYAMSLKAGYQHILDSMLITVNENSINSTCQGCNIPNTFKMYQMSADDRKTLGDMMNFYVDTGDSIRFVPNPAVAIPSATLPIAQIDNAGAVTFSGVGTTRAVVKGQTFNYQGVTYTVAATVFPAAGGFSVTPIPPAAIAANQVVSLYTPLSVGQTGLGETNNQISSGVFNPRNGYQGLNGLVNQGRAQRMQSTSFDPTSAISNYISAAGTGTLFKNYVSENTANAVTYNIFATIPLAVLHDFFEKLPIIRGLNVRLNLYMNTGISITETVTLVNHSAITTTNIPRQTVPFMVSPIANDATVGAGLAVTAAGELKYTLKLGNTTLSNCRFYASIYNFTPEAEARYISDPQRSILYDDVVQFVLPNIGPNANVNSLITSGISRIRGMLIVPIINAASNVCGLDGKQSPFTSCPATTAPFSKIQNFQIQLSGKPVFASAVSSSQLFYNTMLKPELSVNGGSLRSIGTSSGCLSKNDWETGFGFIWVDLSKQVEGESEDNASKSIQVIFQNNVASNLITDFYIYVYYQKEVHLEIGSGKFFSI